MNDNQYQKGKSVSRLFFVIKCLFFLSSVLMVCGCATSNKMTTEEEHYEPYVIDVDKFDPVDLFERMKEESAARDKSKITTCYSIGNVDIKFVPAAKDDSEKEVPLVYDSITDMKGQTYYIERTTALDSSDIEVLCLEKTSFKGIDQYLINVLFEKESWDKVHKLTQDLANKKVDDVSKKLAFIKGQTVVTAPPVTAAIVESATLSGDFDKTNMEWFVNGLTPINQPSADSRHEAYAEWIEMRVRNYPDDTQTLSDLARLYAEKKPNCTKTAATYEKIIMLDPRQYVGIYLHLLHACYKDAANYDKAISFYSAVIHEKKIEPFDEVYLRMALAEAYAINGITEKALNELSQALASVKSLTLPNYPWLEKSPNKDKWERELNHKRNQMIKLIAAATEQIKSKENRKTDK